MKQDGTLWITPETECEAYALEQWRAVRPTRRRMWIAPCTPPTGYGTLYLGSTGTLYAPTMSASPTVTLGGAQECG